MRPVYTVLFAVSVLMAIIGLVLVVLGFVPYFRYESFNVMFISIGLSVIVSSVFSVALTYLFQDVYAIRTILEEVYTEEDIFDIKTHIKRYKTKK